VKYSAGAWPEGCEPLRLISILVLLAWTFCQSVTADLVGG
jgi:hypothetical protein